MDLISLFFPRSCFGCQRKGSYFCTNCLQKETSPKSLCPECKRTTVMGITHLGCLNPLGLDGSISLWRYKSFIGKAIRALKYKFASEIADELSRHSVAEIKKKRIFFNNKPLLIPVPLYWRRKNWRGFNQSEEMGRKIAKSLKWDFDDNLVFRKLSTKPQARLRAEKRLKNISQAFGLKKNPPGNQSIIVFDDVWTTGATIKEIAKVLKRGGAKKVYSLTLAS